VARVKERVAAFERRTGERYDPPDWLLGLGETLSPREACPTLFRFPGPEGLQAHFQGRLRQLGPPGRSHLWLTSRPTGAYPRPVGLFGTLAVLQPLRLQPCRTHCFTHVRDNWIALDRAVDPGEIAWTPPSLVHGPISFDRVRTADDARRRFGKGYEDERLRTMDRLSAYIEELSELRRAGAPGPARHWCTVPATQRRALLARHGLRPRWTRP
jgi:hypothetical protein